MKNWNIELILFCRILIYDLIIKLIFIILIKFKYIIIYYFYYKMFFYLIDNFSISK